MRRSALVPATVLPEVLEPGRHEPAVAPGADLLLAFGVNEPAPHRGDRPKVPIRIADISHLPRSFWLVVMVGGVLTLARFSEAFLVLRAQSVGLVVTWIPLVMVVMNVVYAASAYPAGVLADRGRRHMLLVVGLMALILADVVLAHAATTLWVMVGAAAWGLHMGLTQGLLATMVADTAQVELRGSAFGLFNLVAGGALLVASGLAGWLWDFYGPAFTFYAGAVFTAVALSGVLVLHRRQPLPESPRSRRT